MAAKDYSLDTDKIEQYVKEFADKNNLDIDVHIKNSDKTVYSLVNNKADCKVTVYLKSNGKTSFLSQGKLEDIGNQCINYVIEKTLLPNDINKTLTIKKCNTELYNDFKDSIQKSNEIENIAINDDKIKDRFIVHDTKKARVTITLYKTGTLLIQGSVNTLFIELIVFALETMTNEQEDLHECLNLQNTIGGSISENIKDHITDTIHLEEDNGVLTRMIMTSIQLANSGIKVDDYSCYSFSILRAVEGVLKKRLSEDSPFEGIDFGNFFKKVNGKYVFSRNIATYNNNIPLKNALEDTYTFFNKHRNRTFHTDEMIETSVILDYDDAINIITEALKLINRICNNW